MAIQVERDRLGASCRPGKSFLEHLHDRELMSIEFLEDLVQPSGQFSLFPQQPHDRFHAFVMLPYRSRRHVWVVRRGQHDTGVFCEGLYGSTFARLKPEAFHDSIQVCPNLAAILLHRREYTLQLPVELDYCFEVVVVYFLATAVLCHHCVIAHM